MIINSNDYLCSAATANSKSDLGQVCFRASIDYAHRAFAVPIKIVEFEVCQRQEDSPPEYDDCHEEEVDLCGEGGGSSATQG